MQVEPILLPKIELLDLAGGRVRQRLHGDDVIREPPLRNAVPQVFYQCVAIKLLPVAQRDDQNRALIPLRVEDTHDGRISVMPQN